VTDPVAIYHWRRLDDRITSSGQPTEAQLADLQAIGVREIINLAPHDNARALPDEAASVTRLGMGYTNIPVDFARPTAADFAVFCAVMQEFRQFPVHVHCAANYRVSAFLYRYRREILGVDGAVARHDLDAIWQPDEVWSAFIDAIL
jgi:protein tyrosine phosphatase (PTP) superfamily phosphohydrolase (DUF442 family)